jgi:diguanylate cyclase (GGDEF)-like protein
MADTPFAITVQALGTLMVAALLWQLLRLIPGLFLRYWSIGWICLTVALFALKMSQLAAPHQVPRLLGISVYSVGEFLYGFLLWGGFRHYAQGTPLTWRDARILLVLVPFGLAAPWVLAEDLLLPVHTVMVAAFFAAAFWASLAIHPIAGHPPVVLNIVRVMLFGIALIFFNYGPVLVYSRYYEPLDIQYLRLSPIYDALIELALAFGIVVLVSERAQESLEEKNRQLAESSRRDALTGLYNRRHFDDVVEGCAGQPTGGAIAVIDVNDLKLINDRHLHTAGDAALKLVARSMVSRFRVTDPIFRLGGDEFAVIMPTGTEADLVMRMADMDDALINLRLPGVAEPMDVRIAWGVASYASGDGLPAAFAAADAAMYACKARRKRALADDEDL